MITMVHRHPCGPWVGAEVIGCQLFPEPDRVNGKVSGWVMGI